MQRNAIFNKQVLENINRREKQRTKNKVGFLEVHEILTPRRTGWGTGTREVLVKVFAGITTRKNWQLYYACTYEFRFIPQDFVLTFSRKEQMNPCFPSLKKLILQYTCTVGGTESSPHKGTSLGSAAWQILIIFAFTLLCIFLPECGFLFGRLVLS